MMVFLSVRCSGLVVCRSLVRGVFGLIFVLILSSWWLVGLIERMLLCLLSMISLFFRLVVKVCCKVVILVLKGVEVGLFLFCCWLSVVIVCLNVLSSMLILF